MRSILAVYLLAILLLGACRSGGFYTNPILSNGADPWIVRYDSNYYYCCVMPGNRIGVSKSQKLHQINGPIEVWKAPIGNKWNSSCIWAPELHFWNGKWYIFYAAGYSGPPFIHQKTGVLESVTSDPQGEYIDKGMLFTGDTLGDWSNNMWAIDMTLLEHKKELYAIWSGWEKKEMTDKTQQHLYIAKMENPWTIASSRVKISSPELDYEQGELPLNEGPQILKNKNDLFIIYSCGQSWLPTYKLAYLKLKDETADPLDKDSWIKGTKPLFEGNKNAYGVGHASFTTSPDGEEFYIMYHAKVEKKPGWRRDIRLQKFAFDEKTGLPDFGKPMSIKKKMKLPSGS